MFRLFKYLKNHKLLTLAGPLLKFAEALMETFVPYIMALIINQGIATGDKDFVVKMGLLLVFIAVLGWIFAISAQFFCAKSAMIFGREIRKGLYSKILSMDMEAIDHFTIPSLITRTTNDVNRVENGLNLLLRLMLRIPFIILGSIIMSGVINPKMMLIYIVTVPVLTLIAVVSVKFTMPIFKKIQKTIDRISSFCRENIIGVKSVRAFEMQKSEVEDFDKSADELFENQVKAEKITATVYPLNSLTINIGIIFILIIGAKLVNKEKLLNGDIIALVNYLLQILVAVGRTCSLITSFNKAQASSVRVNEVFDYETPKIDKKSNEKTTNNSENNSLVFENVSFAYSKSDAETISNISFNINQGETFGIIGGTGSGKSTLLALIQGIYPVTSGNIYINGENIANLENKTSLFSVVPQKSLLFKGTLRDNMKFGKPDATDEEIEKALKLAEAYDFVKEKGGLDFEIEYGGKNLSGGQKQRITLARAFMKSAEFLLLDDSTSALDFVTESKIRKNLKFELDCFDIKIIVAQRISAISGCDKILVLDDGKSAGFGTHSELLKSCLVYREIFASQLGEENLPEFTGGML